MSGCLRWVVAGTVALMLVSLSGCLQDDRGPSKGFCASWNQGTQALEYAAASQSNNTSMEAGVYVIEAPDDAGIKIRFVEPAREAHTAGRILAVRSPGATLDVDSGLVKVTVESHTTDAVFPQAHQEWLDIQLLDSLEEGTYTLEVCVENTRSINMEYVSHKIHGITFRVA